MYGCNKLYCELLGTYYARHYKQLAAETASGRVDFRCVRFPGLISAVTMPSGGTSDYAPEMIHAAARKGSLRVLRPARHADSVHGDAGRRRSVADARRRAAGTASARPPTTSARSARRRRRSVTSWSRPFPERGSVGTPTSNVRRIVDSWPADVDDGAARRDWGFSPRYDFARAFSEYLIPTIKKRYA